MNAVVLDRSRSTDAQGATGRRMMGAAVVAGLVALVAATLLSGLSLADPPRATPTFALGTDVVESGWGNEETFGVPGSRILRYDHDTTVEFSVPWTGAPVVDARLGERPVHLVTVTDLVHEGDEVLMTVSLDNCRYFHERAIDIFPGVTLALANGGTAEVLFDRPLLVKSPMLAACPDRTLDRQDDTWGSYRRGG